MLPENVTQARDAATEYTRRAGSTAAAEPLIQDVLRQKITEAYANSQDIVKPLDVATQKYLSAPQAGRERYQNIFNPFQRENLVAQYTGNEALPMLSLSSILGQRFGRIDDTINAGTGAFRSQVLADQAKATQANDLYSALLNEYVTTQQLASQAESDRLAREQFEFQKSKAGSSGGPILSLEDLASLGIGTGTTTPEEEQDEWDVINTQPTWEDPLKKMQQEQEMSNIVGGIGNVNFSGIGGFNSNVR